MSISDFIATLAILVAIVALTITYRTFRREKKKTNQDIIFQEKINAYKDICHKAHEIYTIFFDLVNKVQFYEGTEEDWEKQVTNYVGEFYKFGFDFKKRVYNYVIIIPNEIFKRSEKLSEHFLGFVTTTTHCDAESTINGYNFLGKQLSELIDLVRDDLNVDKLNIELSKRIE